MVPCSEILAKAKEENVDIIGLSGLITPSLEEMTHVASEMQRDEYFKENNIPLLIGGATTSRAHTAVKISDHYEGPVIHVSDASRSVSIMQSLMDPKQKADYLINLSKDYEKVRQLHSNKKGPSYISIEDARKNKLSLKFKPIRPKFIGRRVFKNIDLNLIREYIDWSPFFRTWDLHGKYPAILEDEVVGVSAKNLYQDAEKMLDKVINEKKIKANGVIGFYPANTINDDDIELYASDDSKDPIFTYYGLRQQTKKPNIKGVQKPNIGLADYIAPKISGIKDYIGLFAVTSGINVELYEKLFEKEEDDYNGIMIKAITDRLAEAFAEYMHDRVRRDLWGYQPKELTTEDMIQEKYQGIRPAPGYPACPEHTVKKDIFALLQTEEIGMKLTESMAMYPASSVSGFYFAHPDAKYFSVDKIDDDQLEDMATRRLVSSKQLRKWLGPNLR
jgi:5-methyltetrahydrofolate--homocysteine methyltransferase